MKVPISFHFASHGDAVVVKQTIPIKNTKSIEQIVYQRIQFRSPQSPSFLSLARKINPLVFFHTPSVLFSLGSDDDKTMSVDDVDLIDAITVTEEEAGFPTLSVVVHGLFVCLASGLFC
jgi:hypothetical protein